MGPLCWPVRAMGPWRRGFALAPRAAQPVRSGGARFLCPPGPPRAVSADCWLAQKASNSPNAPNVRVVAGPDFLAVSRVLHKDGKKTLPTPGAGSIGSGQGDACASIALQGALLFPSCLQPYGTLRALRAV